MADRIGAAGGKQQDEARDQRDAGPERTHDVAPDAVEVEDGNLRARCGVHVRGHAADGRVPVLVQHLRAPRVAQEARPREPLPAGGDLFR